jgi:DNA replication protein DnaC
VNNIESIASEIDLISKSLRLKTIHEYREHIDEDKGFEDNLLKILKVEAEMQNRLSIERRTKKAGFPILKTIDTFEFDSKRLPHLKKETVMNLLDCQFIENKTNICAIGPPGTGKSHLMTAIALEAIQKGYSVKFMRASDLAIQLLEAESDKRLGSMLKSLHSYKVLLLDEMGYLTVNA